jgi:[acyl-carrier-protein] S-malonyltransferase
MGAASAILFPGQGSQTPDMRDLVQRVRPDLLEMVVQAVGEDPFPRADEGTNYAQPAIFCASLAGWEALGRPVEAFMAGHSLGEIGALVAAGALDEREGLELVALRGRLMHQSGLEAGEGEGGGGMIAVLGAGASEHAPDIAEAHELTVANDNSPVQVVISGAKSRLADALAQAKEMGLRAMELDVTGAFHSPMMAGAVPEFERALADVTFSEPAEGTTVISAVTAQPFTDPRHELADALTMPVRWREVMLTLHELGAERFVDVGPGRVLTGLAKRTVSGVELVNA